MREAMANARTSGRRGILLVLALAGLFAGIGGVQAHERASAVAEARAAIQAGSEVLIIEPSATEGAQITSAACDRLSRSPAVRAAGAMGAETQRRLAASSATEVTVLPVTRGAVAALTGRSTDALPGALLAPAASNILGMERPGGRLVLVNEDGQNQRIPVAGALRFMRDETRTTAVFDVRHTVDRPRQCWVELERGQRSNLEDVLGAAVAAPGSQVTVRSLLFDGTRTHDPVASYARRPTRTLWLAAAAVAGLLLTVVQGTRRSDMGLYRTLGAPRAAVALILGLEAILMTAVALVVCVAAVPVWGRAVPFGSVAAGLCVAAMAAAVSMSVAIGGVLLVIRGSVQDQLKGG